MFVSYFDQLLLFHCLMLRLHFCLSFHRNIDLSELPACVSSVWAENVWSSLHASNSCLLFAYLVFFILKISLKYFFSKRLLAQPSSFPGRNRVVGDWLIRHSVTPWERVAIHIPMVATSLFFPGMYMPLAPASPHVHGLPSFLRKCASTALVPRRSYIYRLPFA